MSNNPPFDTKARGVCDLRQGEGPTPMKRVCFKPAMFRYAAMGGSWQFLCEEHGAMHRRYSQRWDGEKWEVQSDD